MSLIESLNSWKSHLPHMCLYCANGWLGYGPEGWWNPAVFCANKNNTAHPRTSKGRKLPKKDYMPLMAANDVCDMFMPIEPRSLKACLLDMMGYFDETGHVVVRDVEIEQ